MAVTNDLAGDQQARRAPDETAEPETFQPRIWVITNGRQGSLAQAEGLIAALGAEATTQYFEINLGAPLSWLAPNGPAPLGHVGRKGKKFAPPWPDIVISIGRFAAVYAQKIKRVSKGAVFLLALQNPRMKLEKWDLIWTPEHDKVEGANVFKTLTSPHRLTPQNIATAAAAMQHEIEAMPHPRIAVLIGGPNGAFRMSPRVARDLTKRLDELAPNGSFLITTSRRTPEGVAWTVKQWMGAKPARLWMGGAANPYLGFLGLADAIVVTADSVNMAGEAASTGKPVYVFDLPGRASKFRRFHTALAATGAARALDGTPFNPWEYDAVNANPAVADAVKRAYLAWRGAAQNT